jgi:hypothetical protein
MLNFKSGVSDLMDRAFVADRVQRFDKRHSIAVISRYAAMTEARQVMCYHLACPGHNARLVM